MAFLVPLIASAVSTASSVSKLMSHKEEKKVAKEVVQAAEKLATAVQHTQQPKGYQCPPNNGISIKSNNDRKGKSSKRGGKKEYSGKSHGNISEIRSIAGQNKAGLRGKEEETMRYKYNYTNKMTFGRPGKSELGTEMAGIRVSHQGVMSVLPCFTQLTAMALSSDLLKVSDSKDVKENNQDTKYCGSTDSNTPQTAGIETYWNSIGGSSAGTTQTTSKAFISLSPPVIDSDNFGAIGTNFSYWAVRHFRLTYVADSTASGSITLATTVTNNSGVGASAYTQKKMSDNENSCTFALNRLESVQAMDYHYNGMKVFEWGGQPAFNSSAGDNYVQAWLGAIYTNPPPGAFDNAHYGQWMYQATVDFYGWQTPTSFGNMFPMVKQIDPLSREFLVMATFVSDRERNKQLAYLKYLASSGHGNGFGYCNSCKSFTRLVDDKLCGACHTNLFGGTVFIDYPKQITGSSSSVSLNTSANNSNSSASSSGFKPQSKK